MYQQKPCSENALFTDKSKECAPEIVNNSHVIGLFSGLAEPAICPVEKHIMTTTQTPNITYELQDDS